MRRARSAGVITAGVSESLSEGTLGAAAHALATTGAAAVISFVITIELLSNNGITMPRHRRGSAPTDFGSCTSAGRAHTFTMLCGYSLRCSPSERRLRRSASSSATKPSTRPQRQSGAKLRMRTPGPRTKRDRRNFAFKTRPSAGLTPGQDPSQGLLRERFHLKPLAMVCSTATPANESGRVGTIGLCFYYFFRVKG